MLTKPKQFSVAALLLLLTTPLMADVVLLRSKGEVWYENAEGEVMRAEVNKSNSDAVLVRTGDKSQAVAKVNGDLLILSPNSSVQVKSSSWLEQISGFIYYSIRKVADGEPQHKVTTQTATIGIRGTRFTIAADDSEAATIALEEGAVEVTHNDGDIALQRDPPPQSYDDYKQKMLDHAQKSRDDFQQYKKKQQEAFIEYVASVRMKPGQVLHLDGQSAREGEIDADTKEQMEDLRDYARRVLRQPEFEGM